MGFLMWVGFFVEPSLMQEDIDRLQKFETIPLYSNTPFYELDLPYGVWRSLSEDFRLSISKENTYEV